MAVVRTSALTAVVRQGNAGSNSLRQLETLVAWLPVFLLVEALSLFQVSAVEVYTPQELSVENGTTAKLECTFTSTEMISGAASVTWSFQAEGAPSAASFFYYSNGKPYPGEVGTFKDRISWSGDLNKNDASISIADMQFEDNGTYVCDVKNPPDIVVAPGEIKLRVVASISSGGLPVFPIALVAGLPLVGFWVSFAHCSYCVCGTQKVEF